MECATPPRTSVGVSRAVLWEAWKALGGESEDAALDTSVVAAKLEQMPPNLSDVNVKGLLLALDPRGTGRVTFSDFVDGSMRFRSLLQQASTPRLISSREGSRSIFEHVSIDSMGQVEDVVEQLFRWISEAERAVQVKDGSPLEALQTRLLHIRRCLVNLRRRSLQAGKMQNNALHEHARALQSAVWEATEENGWAKKRLNHHVRENAQLRVLIQQLDENNERLHNQVEESTRARDDQAKALERLKDQLDATRGELRTARHDEETLRKELSQTKKMAREGARAVDDTVARLTQENATLHDKILWLEGERTAREEEEKEEQKRLRVDETGMKTSPEWIVFTEDDVRMKIEAAVAPAKAANERLMGQHEEDQALLRETRSLLHATEKLLECAQQELATLRRGEEGPKNSLFHELSVTLAATCDHEEHTVTPEVPDTVARDVSDHDCATLSACVKGGSRHGDKFGSYVSYLIDTKASDHTYNVRRRSRDFEWLVHVLNDEMDEQFSLQPREGDNMAIAACNEFLDKITSDQRLSTRQCVRFFLAAPYPVWLGFMRNSQAGCMKGDSPMWSTYCRKFSRKRTGEDMDDDNKVEEESLLPGPYWSLREENTELKETVLSMKEVLVSKELETRQLQYTSRMLNERDVEHARKRRVATLREEFEKKQTAGTLVSKGQKDQDRIRHLRAEFQARKRCSRTSTVKALRERSIRSLLDVHVASERKPLAYWSFLASQTSGSEEPEPEKGSFGTLQNWVKLFGGAVLNTCGRLLAR